MHAAEEAGRAAGGTRHGSRSSPPPLAGSNAGATTQAGGSGATLGPDGGRGSTWRCSPRWGGDIAVQAAGAAAAEDVVRMTLDGLTGLATPGEVSGTLGAPVPAPISMRISSAW